MFFFKQEKSLFFFALLLYPHRFVVIKGTYHKGQSSNLNVQRIKALAQLEKFVVINGSYHKVQCSKLKVQR